MNFLVMFYLLFPCYTLAQLNVTVFVCEGDAHVLDCGEGVINISTAMYGRTQSNVCVTSSTTDCEVDVTDELVDSCNGQMQCTVNASDGIAGDPCPGVDKYLEITYICGEGPAHTAKINYPNFGSNYSNNVDIMWRVKAPFGYRVRLHFTDFQTEQCCDQVGIYHGVTQSFDDATQRDRFSGDTIPLNVTSISSFMWIRFTSDSRNQYQGFRVLAFAVTPNWACDFYTDDCGLIVNQGSWRNGMVSNYYFTQAQGDSGDIASFTIPYEFTSIEGTLSFAYYLRYDGSLNVTVCGSQQGLTYGTTNLYIMYIHISYTCDGINDVEITFTATETYSFSFFRVLDIQLYETSVPSRATQSQIATTAQSTTTKLSTSKQSSTSSIPTHLSSVQEHTIDPSTTGIVTMVIELQLPTKGVIQSAVIPAVSSVIVLLVIGLMVVAIFVYLHRRQTKSATANHHQQNIKNDTSLKVISGHVLAEGGGTGDGQASTSVYQALNAPPHKGIIQTGLDQIEDQSVDDTTVYHGYYDIRAEGVADGEGGGNPFTKAVDERKASPGLHVYEYPDLDQQQHHVGRATEDIDIGHEYMDISATNGQGRGNQLRQDEIKIRASPDTNLYGNQKVINQREQRAGRDKILVRE